MIIQPQTNKGVVDTINKFTTMSLLLGKGIAQLRSDITIAIFFHT